MTDKTALSSGGVYCCECGVETPCKWRDLNAGHVFQCPACKLVCGHVWGLHGGSAWVRIEPAQVEFYDLLGEHNENKRKPTCERS